MTTTLNNISVFHKVNANYITASGKKHDTKYLLRISFFVHEGIAQKTFADSTQANVEKLDNRYHHSPVCSFNCVTLDGCNSKRHK